jgi:peptidoglycan LD-endopeptidase LytH
MSSNNRIAQTSLALFALFTFLHCSARAETPRFGTNTSATMGASSSVCRPCEEFNRLTTLVRDGKVPRAEAGKEISSLLPAIEDFYYRNGGRNIGSSEWVFPLRSYGARALGGGRSHGYEPRGYDWFDGNRHKGHPSFDIFIRDRNRNDRDDRTGSFVQVLSLTGGIVVARETGWEPGSGLRGGKYLWIYDPASDALVYYAHNRDLLVGIGALVKPGDPIALVGRTGLNAYRKRSPTHLHLTYLEWKNNSFAPRDIYPQLLKCRIRE